MSSVVTAATSPSSHTTPLEDAAEVKPYLTSDFFAAVQELPHTVSNTRVQLHRTHVSMQQLMARCQAVGAAMLCCTEALAGLTTTPNTSFSTTSTAPELSSGNASGDASAAAAATASYRQLHWSLEQFHTHVAKLLSTGSLQAYDVAVSNKIASRLSLVEHGAAVFAQSVVGSRQRAPADGAAAVQEAARQLEQLACTRFAPAYEGFLLYTVATIGDFCALWNTAAQQSVEKVVWSSGQEGQSSMAVPLHSEQLTTATPIPTKKGRSPTLVSAWASLLHSEARNHRTSSCTLSACFGAAICAVMELRDTLFNYVLKLHATIHQFCMVATTLAKALTPVYPHAVGTPLTGCLNDIYHLDATLESSHTCMTTRQSYYDAIVADYILHPLRQLQEDSKKGVRLDTLFTAINHPRKEMSTALQGALSRFTVSHGKGGVSYRPSRTSSDVHPPSRPVDVMIGVWYKMSELCVQVGTNVSDEFTKRVNV